MCELYYGKVPPVFSVIGAKWTHWPLLMMGMREESKCIPFLVSVDDRNSKASEVTVRVRGRKRKQGAERERERERERIGMKEKKRKMKKMSKDAQ